MDNYCMTIKEASEYSKIGINRLREITKADNCPFVLRVGAKKRLIKIDAFREWLNKNDRV